jgi:tetratricopeptide (TPR) repeat protein
VKWAPTWSCCGAILAPVLLCGAIARADTPPSAWDLAKDPAARDRWELHVRVMRLMPRHVRRGSAEDELRLEAVRAVLEGADAAHSPDVRLRFDLGIVYEDLANLLWRDDLRLKAVSVLAPAVDASPDHPAATGALDALVDAYAKLGRPREELAVWRRYVPRLLDDRVRAPSLMNMGEAQMRVGSLDEALDTFRAALRLCEELPNSIAVNEWYALTLWDLALALDRSGDSVTALDTAAKARAWSWQKPGGQIVGTVTGWDAIHDTEDVFFVPAWERDWYFALGHAAAARASSDPRDSARSWAAAERHWNTYTTGSEATGGRDPWLSIARARRDHARAERLRAESRAAKLRARPPANEPWTSD